MSQPSRRIGGVAWPYKANFLPNATVNATVNAQVMRAASQRSRSERAGRQCCGAASPAYEKVRDERRAACYSYPWKATLCQLRPSNRVPPLIFLVGDIGGLRCCRDQASLTKATLMRRFHEHRDQARRGPTETRSGKVSPMKGNLRLRRRMPVILAVAVVALAPMGTTAASASSTPSGEVVVGRTVIEPAYDSMTGAIKYLLTPMGAPNPVKSNPISWAPIYIPVYPVDSTVGTLLCQHTPVENCPDHGPLVAGGAALIDPIVYGDGVMGHDHLMAGPASGGDFNIAWEPILVLFTSKAAANTHLITKAQVDAAVTSGAAFEVPLPPLTFNCSVVSQAVYARGTPLL